MFHPLGNNLRELKDEELQKKYGDLMKRLNQALRTGPTTIIPQLQLLLADYQEELNRRQQVAFEEMMKKAKDSGKDFDGIIDIQ